MVTTERRNPHTTIVQYNSVYNPAASSPQTGLSWLGVGIAQPNQRSIALETVFAAIKSTSDEEAQRIVHQIRSNHSLEYIAAYTSKPELSVSNLQDGEADHDRIERLTTEEQRPRSTRAYGEHAAGVAQRRSISRRRPANRKSEHELKNTNAPGKKKPIVRNAQRRKASGSSSSEPFLPQPISQSAVKDLFLERWLDANFPVVPSTYGSSDTIRAALGARIASPILGEAYQSVSTVYFGQSVGDLRVMFAGQKIYAKVLRGLQKALLSPHQSRSAGTLLTATLLMIYEVTGYDHTFTIEN
jgi:hypothetical protein